MQDHSLPCKHIDVEIFLSLQLLDKGMLSSRLCAIQHCNSVFYVLEFILFARIPRQDLYLYLYFVTMYFYVLKFLLYGGILRQDRSQCAGGQR